MNAVLDRSGKPMRLVGVATTTPLTDTKAKPLRVCSCSSRIVASIAEYMVAEMKRNPFTAEGKRMTEANNYDIAKEMKEWNALPWYGKIGGPPNFASISAGKKLAAYTIWAERVGPNRPWDHKPILRRRLDQEKALNGGWQRYGNEDYYYDIWSNIHYGYVGVACGFGLDELLNGAALAQAGSDIARDMGKLRRPTVQHHPENGPWPNTLDDIPDNISIKVGVALYSQAKPAVLTPAGLLKAIMNVPIPWGAGLAVAKRHHMCPK